MGRKVAGLSRGDMISGEHSFVWNGVLDTGHPAPSGLYFCKLTAGEQVQSRAVVLLH